MCINKWEAKPVRKEITSTLRASAIVSTAFLLGACASGGGGFSSSLSPQSISAPSTQPVRPTPQLAPPPRAETLIGLDAYGLRGQFGSPDFQRSEPGAEVWRYGGDACSLFFYMYEDESNTLRTAFVEARAEAGGELPKAPCIADISRQHQLSALGY